MCVHFVVCLSLSLRVDDEVITMCTIRCCNDSLYDVSKGNFIQIFIFFVKYLDCFKTTWNENLLYVLLLSLSLVCILSVFPLLSLARGENTFFFFVIRKTMSTLLPVAIKLKNVCQASYWFYCFVSDFILSISNDHKIEYCFYVASVIHKLFTSPTYLLILNDSSSLL